MHDLRQSDSPTGRRHSLGKAAPGFGPLLGPRHRQGTSIGEGKKQQVKIRQAPSSQIQSTTSAPEQMWILSSLPEALRPSITIARAEVVEVTVDHSNRSVKKNRKHVNGAGEKNAREGCPAGSLLCQSCGKPDHFARIYRFRPENTTHVRAIDEAVCLGAIDSENHWTRTLFVNGQPMKLRQARM